MIREPDCEYCGGKTPPDRPPMYYTCCVHDELCPKVWGCRFGALVAEVPAREFIARFAEYVEKVKAAHRPGVHVHPADCGWTDKE